MNMPTMPAATISNATSVRENKCNPGDDDEDASTRVNTNHSAALIGLDFIMSLTSISV